MLLYVNSFLLELYIFIYCILLGIFFSQGIADMYKNHCDNFN